MVQRAGGARRDWGLEGGWGRGRTGVTACGRVSGATDVCACGRLLLCSRTVRCCVRLRWWVGGWLVGVKQW